MRVLIIVNEQIMNAKTVTIVITAILTDNLQRRHNDQDKTIQAQNELWATCSGSNAY